MSGSNSYFTANPFLRFAAGERFIRAVTGVPGVITDGEYDLATLGAAAFDVSAVALIAAVERAVQKASDIGLRKFGMERDIELQSRGGSATLFRVLDAGVAALQVIDLVNGAGAPDAGGDFLTAADLLDGAGGSLAAAGPDAGRWAGGAAAGYGDHTRAVMSDVDALRELDKQMQTLMARQADAVQKAHLTVAGGLNTLVLCYPIAMWLFMTRTHTQSVAFQIAAVSAVLGGVSTMEYLTVDESAEVGRQADAIAEQYRALFPSVPGSSGNTASATSPPASGDAAAIESGSPSVPASSAMPTVTQLAARAGDGRPEQLRSMLSLLAAGQAPDVNTDADNEPGTAVSGPAATLPANPAPPTGVGTPITRAAPAGVPQGRADTAAPTNDPQATADRVDETASLGSDGADTGAAGGVHPAGTAPLYRPAGQAPAGNELVTAPRST